MIWINQLRLSVPHPTSPRRSTSSLGRITLMTHLRRIADGRTDLVHEALTDFATNSDLTVDGANALKWCAYYGDTSSIRALLEHGAELTQLGDDLGLGAASFHGHWQLCQYLLESGADPNFSDPQTGETPLHSAMTNEDRDRYDLVAAVLLQRGANPNAATLPNKITGAFMRDCRTKGETPLHRAAAFCRVETIEALLAAGADLERKDMNGDSPLGWASWYRRPHDVLRVLAYGPHRVRAGNPGMRVHLLGSPTPPDAP
jgi:ankyrin repeat protein